MHREALSILIAEGFLFFLSIMGWGVLAQTESLVMASVFAMTMIFTLYFFRDPERECPEQDNVFISPADGRVVHIGDIPYFPLSTGSVKVVTIYLSLWNVHVNRVPISGRVTYLNHSPGSYYPAFNRHSSSENEHMMIGITGALGHVFVKQIAGMVAQRIVCHLQMGDQVERGQRFGMIKFGSRVELYLPKTVSIKVSQGDHVRGGESIIAEKI